MYNICMDLLKAYENKTSQEIISNKKEMILKDYGLIGNIIFKHTGSKIRDSERRFLKMLLLFVAAIIILSIAIFYFGTSPTLDPNDHWESRNH